MHSFDAKINDENKTKCLQTLKENYWDLEKKQVFCDNEAEMRCYMVLMNLNQGDILRSIFVIKYLQFHLFFPKSLLDNMIIS
jgi:hypothetical protein